MSHVKGMLTNTVFIEAFYEFCSQLQFLSESCDQTPNISFLIIIPPPCLSEIKFSCGCEGFFGLFLLANASPLICFS